MSYGYATSPFVFLTSGFTDRLFRKSSSFTFALPLTVETDLKKYKNKVDTQWTLIMIMITGISILLSGRNKCSKINTQ